MADDTSPAPAAADPNPVTKATTHPDNLRPASLPEASGALQEPDIAKRVDTDHPAVDNAPRAGLPASSNQIDFNDPTKPGQEAVADALKDQGLHQPAADKKS